MSHSGETRVEVGLPQCTATVLQHDHSERFPDLGLRLTPEPGLTNPDIIQAALATDAGCEQVEALVERFGVLVFENVHWRGVSITQKFGADDVSNAGDIFWHTHFPLNGLRYTSLLCSPRALARRSQTHFADADVVRPRLADFVRNADSGLITNIQDEIRSDIEGRRGRDPSGLRSFLSDSCDREELGERLIEHPGLVHGIMSRLDNVFGANLYRHLWKPGDCLVFSNAHVQGYNGLLHARRAPSGGAKEVADIWALDHGTIGYLHPDPY